MQNLFVRSLSSKQSLINILRKGRCRNQKIGVGGADGGCKNSRHDKSRDQRRKQELGESFFPAVCFVEGFLPGDKAGKKEKRRKLEEDEKPDQISLDKAGEV